MKHASCETTSLGIDTRPKGVVPQPLNSGGRPPLGARIKGGWRSVFGVRGFSWEYCNHVQHKVSVFTSAPPSQGRKDSLSAVQPKLEHSPYTLVSSLTNVSCSSPRLPRHAAPLNDADSALFSSPRFQSRQLCSWWRSHHRTKHLQLRGCAKQ